MRCSLRSFDHMFFPFESHYEKNVFCNWPCNSFFWIVMDIYNSPYIRCNSLQLNQKNSFSTTILFHYNYTHDVMLMSLIVIHLLKSNTWHYKEFLTFKNQNIDLHCPLWCLMTIQDYNMWHNKKIATWHINYIYIIAR
jgi:hypothetical protein